MTKEEFADFIKVINNIWDKPFDESKIRDWQKIFEGFKRKGLIMSVYALSKESHFQPSIKQIVDKYDELRRDAEAERRQKQIDQQRSLAAEARQQHQCQICDNSGIFMYARTAEGTLCNMTAPSSYDYACRCTCARGKDLNRWSEPQIKKGELWYNPRTRRKEDIYAPDVNDIFTTEEIAIIMARKSSIYKNGESA